MATNEESLNRKPFWELIVVALQSALENTTLVPNLIYDGQPSARLDILEKMGVRVWQKSLSFKHELEKVIKKEVSHPESAAAAVARSGAYLRFEIPKAVEGCGEKYNYVLYTDCDVLFLSDPDIKAKPKYIAACSRKEGGRTRFKIGGYKHFQSGVMLLNTVALRREYDSFVNYVLKNAPGARRPIGTYFQKHLVMSDQVATNLFYKGKLDSLPDALNWNPSRGLNPSAIVVHFNGLKWNEWEDYKGHSLGIEKMAKYKKLADASPEGYEHYSKVACQVRDRAWVLMHD